MAINSTVVAVGFGGRAAWRIAVMLASLLGLCGTRALAVAGIDVVVSTGEASPDGNGQLTLHYAPTINAAGQLAFVTDLIGTSGGAADNHALVRRETSGQLTMIGRRGQIYNGQPINTFFPTSASIDSEGLVSPVVAFGPPTTLLHMFGDGGPLTPMYEPGSPSPSGNNALLAVLTAVTNDSGLSVYRGVYNGAVPESGLYQRAANGAVSTRILQNTPAPRGGNISGFASRPSLNESGQIGVIMNVNTGTTIQSAVRVDGTTVHELVREGDLLADGITTVTDIKTSALISDNGQVAYVADYSRPGSIGQGVFRSNTSGTALVAPGLLPGGSTAANNMQLLGISSTGKVALTTEFLGGGFDPLSGVYVADTAGATLVAFEDTATPVAGKFFRSFFSEAVVMNDAGQLAFLAELSDSANGAAAGRGLYFYDSTSGLQEIIRTGNALEGSTISNLFFVGTVNGNSTQSPDTSHSGLNSAGQVAFAFQLANGQDGIGIWAAATLPGDYNGDNMVDAGDYVAWNAAFGGSNSGADGNSDGVVDAADYVLWRRSLEQAGEGSGAFSSSVPEPGATVVLLCLIAASLMLQRKINE